MQEAIKNAAFTQIIKAMQRDAEDIMNAVDLAAGDLGEGRRNGAMGALATLDVNLERIGALLSAVRAMHRLTPL
jgi:gamma-glutamyl phosphate reductase